MASLIWFMGLMSVLKRREEGDTPSCPVGQSTTTGMPFGRVTLQIPAIYVAICTACVPMRIVLASKATPTLPISILLLPVVRLAPARLPTAMLDEPVVLFWSAPAPLAVLSKPVRLFKSAVSPVAVLLCPVWLNWRAAEPVA